MNRTAQDYINENPYLHLQPTLLKAEIANIMEAYANEKQVNCLQKAAENATIRCDEYFEMYVDKDSITNPNNLV